MTYDYVAALRALDRKMQVLIDQRFDALEDSLIPPTLVTFIKRAHRDLNRFNDENYRRPVAVHVHPDTMARVMKDEAVRVWGTEPRLTDQLMGIPLYVTNLAPRGQAVFIGGAI